MSLELKVGNYYITRGLCLVQLSVGPFTVHPSSMSQSTQAYLSTGGDGYFEDGIWFDQEVPKRRLLTNDIIALVGDETTNESSVCTALEYLRKAEDYLRDTSVKITVQNESPEDYDSAAVFLTHKEHSPKNLRLSRSARIFVGGRYNTQHFNSGERIPTVTIVEQIGDIYLGDDNHRYDKFGRFLELVKEDKATPSIATQIVNPSSPQNLITQAEELLKGLKAMSIGGSAILR